MDGSQGRVIRFESVSVASGEGPPILSQVSFEIQQGEFVWFAGPTGAGHNAALRLMHLGQRADSGTVVVGGVELGSLGRAGLPLLRRSVVLLDRRPRLVPGRTALENVALPLELAGHPAEVAARKARSALLDVGLGHRGRRLAASLSEPEQRLCAVARALAMAPSALLADEPTSGLDPELAASVTSLLESAHRRGATVLWATCRPERWAQSPHRVLRFVRGEVVEDRPARDLEQWLPDFQPAEGERYATRDA